MKLDAGAAGEDGRRAERQIFELPKPLGVTYGKSSRVAEMAVPAQCLVVE